MQNNFFGDFLDEILGDIPHKTIVDQAYVKINNHLTLKIYVDDPYIRYHYETLRLFVVDHSIGGIDTMKIDFEDVFEQNPADAPTRFPYIWNYNGKLDWYYMSPNKKSYVKLRNLICEFIDVYKEDV